MSDTRHYRNLTNGLACPHVMGDEPLVRIQSTWCEQKRWEDVLLTAGPDLLFRLAQGDRCVIHDVSERPRETRACWQGLSWLRYACTQAWIGDEAPQFSRSGMNVTSYWRQQYGQLTDHARTYIRYFAKHWTGGPVRLHSCYGLEEAA